MVFKYHGVNGLMGFTENDIYEKGQQGQRGKKGFVIALSMVNHAASGTAVCVQLG